MARPKLISKSLPVLLADAIKLEIRHGQIVDTLPGYRVLMKRFDVSQVTAKSAIQILEKQGVVTASRKGKGREICAKMDSLLKKLKTLLVIREKKRLPMEEALHTFSMLKRVWQNYEGDVLEHEIDIGNKSPDLTMRRLFKRFKPDAVVSSVLPVEWNAAIAECGAPLYLVGGGQSKFFNYTGCGYSQREASMLSFEKLKQKGHERILYPIHTSQLMFLDTIKLAYREIFPDLNEAHIDAYMPIISEDYPDVWQSFLDRCYFNLKPTGIVVNTLSHLLSVYNFCARHQLNIPNDLSVVCEKDNSEIAWLVPQPCRIESSDDQQRKHFMKWVKSDCSWLNFTMIPIDWIEGETICRIGSRS